MSEDGPLVEIRVMVNVNSMRRGQTGQVELTPRIQALVDNGYLEILGHVTPQLEIPSAHADLSPLPTEDAGVVTPTETPAVRTRPSRAKRRPTETPPEEVTDGDSAGGVVLE